MPRHYRKEAAQKAAREKAKLSTNKNNHDHWVWFGEVDSDNEGLNLLDSTLATLPTFNPNNTTIVIRPNPNPTQLEEENTDDDISIVDVEEENIDDDGLLVEVDDTGGVTGGVAASSSGGGFWHFWS